MIFIISQAGKMPIISVFPVEESDFFPEDLYNLILYIMKRLKRLLCRHKHCKITDEVITRDLYKNPYYGCATSYRYETKITCKCLNCGKIIEKNSTK